MEYVSYTDGKIPSVKLLNLVVMLDEIASPFGVRKEGKINKKRGKRVES
jgi:hypothetical protein